MLTHILGMPTAVRCGQPTKTPRRAWAPGLGAEPLLRATQVPSLLFFTSVIPGPIEGPIRSGSLASVWRGVQGTGNSPLEMQWSGGQQRCPFRSEQPQPEEGGRATALQPTMAIARDTGWRAKKTRTKEDEEVDRTMCSYWWWRWWQLTSHSAYHGPVTILSQYTHTQRVTWWQQPGRPSKRSWEYVGSGAELYFYNPAGRDSGWVGLTNTFFK